jgi:hypothetical protein
VENEPNGVRFELTANGFQMRASYRSFTNIVFRVGFAAVLSSLPYVLWWDLILGVWYEEGPGFWITIAFLAVWAAAIAYVDILALLALAGEVRITKENDQGKIFNGIGKLGWTRSFRWSDFNGLSLVSEQKSADGRSFRSGGILLSAPAKSYKFGWLLPEERRSFITAMLQKHVFNVNEV